MGPNIPYHLAGFGSTSQAALGPVASELPKPATNIFGQSTAAYVNAPNTQQIASTSSPFGVFGAAQQQQSQAGSLNNAFGATGSGSTPSALIATSAPTTGSIFGTQSNAPAINVLNPNGSTTTQLFPPGGTGPNLAPPPSNTASGLFPPTSGATLAGVTSKPSPFGPFGQQQGLGAFGPFGASANAASVSSQPTSNASPFASSTSTFGTSPSHPSIGQGTTNLNTIEAQIQAIEAAITPGSPSNRFQVSHIPIPTNFFKKSDPLPFSTISTILSMQARYISTAALLTPQTKSCGCVRTEKIPTLRGMLCALPRDTTDDMPCCEC